MHLHKKILNRLSKRTIILLCVLAIDVILVFVLAGAKIDRNPTHTPQKRYSVRVKVKPISSLYEEEKESPPKEDLGQMLERYTASLPTNLPSDLSEPANGGSRAKAPTLSSLEELNRMKKETNPKDAPPDFFEDDDALDFSIDQRIEEVRKSVSAADGYTGPRRLDKEKEESTGGQSTITYYVKNRYAVRIPNPLYQCIEEGSIWVNVWVNHQGFIDDAEIDPIRSSTENGCLQEVARSYTKKARFNVNYDSPELQKGYVIFRFSKR